MDAVGGLHLHERQSSVESPDLGAIVIGQEELALDPAQAVGQALMIGLPESARVGLADAEVWRIDEEQRLGPFVDLDDPLHVHALQKDAAKALDQCIGIAANPLGKDAAGNELWSGTEVRGWSFSDQVKARWTVVDTARDPLNCDPVPAACTRGKGNVTGMAAITGRSVFYVAQGGQLRIFSTTTSSEIGDVSIAGAIIDVKAVDK